MKVPQLNPDRRPGRRSSAFTLIELLLVLVILGVFAWALHGGQFDDLEQHGERMLRAGETPLDPDQP
ncbi:MAG: cbb3-type cytochrome oxidase assembly protein CcoS [Burkholderiales bacterium]|nr:cbb3-type cytochrome oxidase assembly protein CcoS [Burkholderiales bacterium]